MGKLTLFELHTHGEVQFGPDSFSPGIETGSSTEEDLSSAAEEDDEGLPTKKVGIGLLLAVVVLAALAGAAKYLLGGDGPVDLAESDDM